MKNSLFGIALISLLTLAGCGGGGGGSGAPAPQPDDFTISTNSVTFNALPGGSAPPPQVVSGSIVNVTSTVYLYVTSPGPVVGSASFVLTGQNTGQLTLVPRSPSLLGNGTFSETVTVRACLDSGCAQQVRGSPKSINVTYNIAGIRLSPQSVTLSAVEGMPSNSVNIDVTSVTGTGTWTTSVSYGASATGWLNVTPASGSTAPTSLTISAAGRNQGIHTATLTMQSGSYTANVGVTYQVVAPTLTVNPTSTAFVVNAATPSAPQNTINTASTGAQLNWMASSSVPWLSVTPSGTTGQPLIVSIVSAQLGPLANGVLSGTINVSYSGPGVSSAATSLPVTLNLGLPTLTTVAPYAAYVGGSDRVILRGSGLTGVTADAIRFGAQSVAAVEAINDSTLQVQVPTLSQGTYTISIGNNFGPARGSARFVVKQPLTFSYTTLPSMTTKSRLLFDVERQNLYAVSPAWAGGQLERFHYDGAAWTKLTSLVLPMMNGAVLSTDGTKLYVVTDTKLYSVDLTNEPLVSTELATNPEGFCGYYWADVGVSNNEKIMLVGAYHQCSGFPNLYLYDASSRALGVLSSIYSPGVAMTPANGRRIYTGFSGIAYYDSETDTFSGTNISQSTYFYNTPVARDDSKLLLFGNRVVYDRNFNVLGAVGPYLTQFHALSPDGKKAYTVADPNSSSYTPIPTNTVSVSDLTAPLVAGGGLGGAFPEVATFPITTAAGVVPSYALDGLLVSPDGRALFLGGGGDIYVVPLP